MAKFKDTFEKGSMFASELAVNYGASIPVVKIRDSADQGDGTDVGPRILASNIKLGIRFTTFQVLNQSDARPRQFGQFLKSDGRFRIIVFAGNFKDEKQWKWLQGFERSLAKPDSVIRRFAPSAKPIDSVIESLVYHPAPRQEVKLLELHEMFHPFDEKRAWVNVKVFVDDVSYHQGHREAYKNHGVDRESSCMVIGRPD